MNYNNKVIENSKIVTNINLNKVREGIINCINPNKPFYATTSTIAPVINDMDNFPYNRFYRGEYNNPTPVVLEREAGWRPREDNCYKHMNIYGKNTKYPSVCFQVPCSTIYPCYPKSLHDIYDREFLELLENRKCVSSVHQ